MGFGLAFFIFAMSILVLFTWLRQLGVLLAAIPISVSAVLASLDLALPLHVAAHLKMTVYRVPDAAEMEKFGHGPSMKKAALRRLRFLAGALSRP